MANTQSIPSVYFSTKAGTLENLRSLMKNAEVLPMVRIGINELCQKERIQALVNGKFSGDKVIVRSSAWHEDGKTATYAGKYLSIAGVDANDEAALREAVDSVMKSYDSADERHEVFIQPLLTDVEMSGVALTCDPDTFAPYYILNFETSGSCSGVTSGSHGTDTYIRFREAPFDYPDENIGKVIKTCQELELLFNCPELDVEFAISKGKVYVLQVRRIPDGCHKAVDPSSLLPKLEEIGSETARLSDNSRMQGNIGIYGVMPDWNPAEMIGNRPAPLAYSLYKYLITDGTWAKQRKENGYRDMTGFPLMHSFAGIPFIDVRADFNSFIPADLNENTAEKLINHYLEKLKKNPSLHDKIEFRVALTCYCPGIENETGELKLSGFSDNETSEILKRLKHLTGKIVNRTETKSAGISEENYDSIMGCENIGDCKNLITQMLAHCRDVQALSFAGAARRAFVGVRFLKGLVNTGLLNIEQYYSFLSSIHTITGQMKNDMVKLRNREITRDEFLRLYGHLRPGTYDIMSLRYDEDFEGYFPGEETGNPTEIKNNGDEFTLTTAEMDNITEILRQSGFYQDAPGFEPARLLFRFISDSIREREHLKFNLSKTISGILSLIVKIGEKSDISREELPYLTIESIHELPEGVGIEKQRKHLLETINHNRQKYHENLLIKLPPLICNQEQIYHYFLPPEEPNFVTLKRISAQVLHEDQLFNDSVEGKIIMINSAEPGYDYLFTRGIAGLITLYGGVNSHAAIRCAEARIPAVIGAGEKNFAVWSAGNVLDIDCANRKVTIIR